MAENLTPFQQEVLSRLGRIEKTHQPTLTKKHLLILYLIVVGVMLMLWVVA